jgi:hypothetical protein
MNTDGRRSEGRVGALRRYLFGVPQTSKSAVPQVSKPAGRNPVVPAWKPAAQQVWKPALRNIGESALNRFRPRPDAAARRPYHPRLALYFYLRSSAFICGSRFLHKIQLPALR